MSTSPANDSSGPSFQSSIDATQPDDTATVSAPAASAAAQPHPDAAQIPVPPLRAHSTLSAAIEAFEEHMLRKGFSDNTIKAFRNDLKIVRAFLEGTTQLRTISTSALNDFLHWLQNERGRPCNAKTLARRITTLKVFFGWLHDTGILGNNPAEAVVQQPVRTPLPSILYDDEVNRLVRAAQDLLWHRAKPDARPYLLVSLLLHTGIKKGECANLLLGDIDVSRSQEPEVAIRYAEARYRHKNRRLPLSPNFPPVLKQYLDQYKPEHYLFECTPRNLEYVLDEVGRKANIQRLQVGFETLRWTAAVRDFRKGAQEEQLRQKMGLSKVSWRDTRDKIFRLAGRI